MDREHSPPPADPPEAETRSGPSRAVAIRGDDSGPGGGPGDEAARRPRVIAKGEGALAEQILAIAFDRGIKVRTDADLTEILSAVEVDSEIPLEALAAVAETLSYVYRTTRTAAPAGSRLSARASPGAFVPTRGCARPRGILRLFGVQCRSLRAARL